MSMKILLTGKPGCGKTTVVMRALARMEVFNPVGFYTEEVRLDGQRIGFDIVTLDGRRATLARKSPAGVPRVGAYVVDVNGFEELALQALAVDAPLYVVDEIGKMECLSRSFVDRTRALLCSRSRFLGTVGLLADGFPAEVRKCPDYTVLSVTPESRDALPDLIVRLLA